MYEEKTERVRQGYLIFQGILAHKKKNELKRDKEEGKEKIKNAKKR